MPPRLLRTQNSTIPIPCGGMPASPHTPLPRDADCKQESPVATGVAPATPPADSAQWSAFYMNRFLTRS